MIKSIRSFLIIYLLLTLMITTVLTALGNYYLDKRDIQQHSDIILSHAGLNMHALLNKNLTPNDLKKIQYNVNRIPEHARNTLGEEHQHLRKALSDKYQYQIWQNEDQLLIKSLQAPGVPFSTNAELGLQTKSIQGNQWRIFSHYNPESKLRVEIAEQLDKRDQLSNSLALDDLYLMLLTFPITGLIIWLIVGYSFKGVREIADEVSHRVPNYLEPVNTNKIPEEIKPLTEELNKLFLRLHHAFEREKRFAGDAAHELKTPLAALKTQAQVTLKLQDHEQIQQRLRYIIESVDRCAHIVQQLLTLSRLAPEAENLSDMVPIDLNKLAADVVAEQAHLAIEKKIDIELIPSQTDKAMIKGNVTALSILIRNLVDNAIRYTPPLGAVQIKIIVNPKNIKLKVIDNGPGIPEKLRTRVFERFYRVLGSGEQGSGLGLAIVAQITELHQASLSLNAGTNGKGLEVEVKFPR